MSVGNNPDPMARIEAMFAQMNARMTALEERDRQIRIGDEDDEAGSNAEGHGSVDGRNPRVEPNRQNNNYHSNFKANIPAFSGVSDPDVYMDWEQKMEMVFLSQNTPDNAKLKIAVLEFTGYALSWWQQQELRTERRMRRRINSWEMLKDAMRERFIPKEYKRTTYQKLQKLYQGRLSVDEYFKEMERLMTRAEVIENDDATMARFISGLHGEYADVVDLHRGLTLTEAYEMAIKLEGQARRKEKRYGLNPKTGVETKGLPAGHSINQNRTVSSEQRPNSSSRLRDVICFKCQGRGHYSTNCPNKRVVYIDKQTGEYFSDPEEEVHGCQGATMAEPGEVQCEVPDDDDSDEDLSPLTCAVSVKVLNTQVARDDSEEQRENLFHCRCEVKGKICSVIVDNGSCVNVASEMMVKALGLITVNHPEPYKLQWLSQSSEVKVRKQVTFDLKIKSYEGPVTCDVIPMQACHVLLGRPWQYDRAICYDGRLNQITFQHGDKKVVIKALSVKAVNEDREFLYKQYKGSLKEKKGYEQEGKRMMGHPFKGGGDDASIMSNLQILDYDDLG